MNLATETTADVDDQAILEIAREADAATPDRTEPPAKPAAEATKPAAATTAATENPTTTAQPSASAKPETSRETEESKFSKARKEADRRDRSWQALEREKETFRTERQQLLERQNALQRELQQLRAAPVGPTKDEHGATAEDYEALARRYQQEGNDELVKEARARADRLRQQPAKAPAPALPDTAEFQAEWQRHTQEVLQKEPELADPANPVVKAANSLVNDPTYSRFFRASPDGIKAAVEVAKLMRAAHGAQELESKLKATETELATSKKEIERLNSLLQPRSSQPGGPKGKPKDADLTDDDVARMAAAADRGEL